MRVAAFYLFAFIALIGGMAALANADYIGATWLFALVVILPFLGKAA